MENENALNEMEEYTARVLRAEHRYYQEVTVTLLTADARTVTGSATHSK